MNENIDKKERSYLIYFMMLAVPLTYVYASFRCGSLIPVTFSGIMPLVFAVVMLTVPLWAMELVFFLSEDARRMKVFHIALATAFIMVLVGMEYFLRQTMGDFLLGSIRDIIQDGKSPSGNTISQFMVLLEAQLNCVFGVLILLRRMVLTK